MEKKEWKFILLDFDFTIADSSSGIIECFNRSFKELGLSICEDQMIMKTIGMSLLDAFFVLKKDQDYNVASQFVTLFRNYSQQSMIAHTYIYTGVKDILMYFHKKGIKIGIVTAKDSNTVKKILKKYECDSYIDAIVGEENSKESKPNPEPIYLAMNQLNANKKQTVYIGDSLIDAKTSQNANVDFIAVLSGYTSLNTFLESNIPVFAIYKNINECWKALS